jgi:Toxin co-regulated pilus biosynthesis protein Q
MKNKHFLKLIAIAILFTSSAWAQIQMMSHPYIEPKVIAAPAAPTAPALSPAPAAASVATPVAPALSPALANMGPTVLGGGAAASQVSVPAVALEAVVPPAPVIAKPATIWKVELKDVYIANTLQRWASGQGWRVKWDAAKNFVVEAPDSYAGTFEEAVTALLSAPGIQNSRYPVDVCFFPNTPPLARITLRGEQDKECK